ncbi:glycosyltransferase [Viscerimonas tarda]
MKVFIDPRSTINYSSYYIRGLYDVFGKRHVAFSSRFFNELEEIDMLMAFVITDKDATRKIIIDYRDQHDVIEQAYEWSDVYAKININLSTPHYGSNKLINIAPSFSIKIWNPVELCFQLVSNFLKAKIWKHTHSANIHLRPQRWIRNYLSLLKRQPLQSYTNHTASDRGNYVFFVSTFWAGENATNLFRQHYILSCARNDKINFDGGFFVNKNVAVPQNIPSKLIFNSYLSNKSYLKNIQNSIFVFNTSAVLNCHGWKLGEFLCIGKAIISTSLINELPAPLQHGKDIYLANDETEIEQAIDRLLTNNELRTRLEENARAYYTKYASPVKVIEKIVERAK